MTEDVPELPILLPPPLQCWDVHHTHRRFKAVWVNLAARRGKETPAHQHRAECTNPLSAILEVIHFSPTALEETIREKANAASYQFCFQGSDSAFISSFLGRKLLLSHFFGNLNSLHHFFLCLQLSIFYFCFKPIK